VPLSFFPPFYAPHPTRLMHNSTDSGSLLSGGFVTQANLGALLNSEDQLPPLVCTYSIEVMTEPCRMSIPICLPRFLHHHVTRPELLMSPDLPELGPNMTYVIAPFGSTGTIVIQNSFLAPVAAQFVVDFCRYVISPGYSIGIPDSMFPYQSGPHVDELDFRCLGTLLSELSLENARDLYDYRGFF